MGKREDADHWVVQLVLIKKISGEEKAREQADEIIRQDDVAKNRDGIVVKIQ